MQVAPPLWISSGQGEQNGGICKPPPSITTLLAASLISWVHLQELCPHYYTNVHTHPANKAFRVPQGIECRDVVLQNGLIAPLAAGGKQLVEVLATVLLPIFLMKACRGGNKKDPVSKKDGNQLTMRQDKPTLNSATGILPPGLKSNSWEQ